jgi:colanic acid/amylovoran biosynthesis protein
MKILLLNQPVYNRGDEAAHRSLIRTINNSIPNALITIVLENIKEGTIHIMNADKYWQS